ncbi:MAG TPA: hypothetical protein VJL54_09175 [Nitrososphaera sp.]|nr:hypothetical protein [Nitrososphaera sp.]
MINGKMAGMLVAAFVGGCFLASPELRAYASTIANDVICTGCVGTSDLAGNAVTAGKIKDNEVKAAEIATDAVGAAELQGVTKLMFAQCILNNAEQNMLLGEGAGFAKSCQVNGVDGDDTAVATVTAGGSCIGVTRADALTNSVSVFIRNMCISDTIPEPGAAIAIIVFDK